jgi:hypothetical protein
METRPFFTLLVLLLAGGAFADAYKWTDEDGIVHFSDRPHPGAERIVLGEFSDQRPASTTGLSSGNSSAPPLDPGPAYTSIEIVSPAAEETLWNIETVLNVDLDLVPSLKPGHQLRVYYDGMPQLRSTPSFQLTEVYRGVHNLQAEVIDSTGKLLIRSRPSRFYVQQNTVR